MSKIITGHEADIESINHDTEAWENDIKAQLRHIIALAENELESLDLTHDILGVSFEPGSNKVNRNSLKSIVACVERIRNLQS